MDERLNVERIEKFAQYQRLIGMLHLGYTDQEVREEMQLDVGQYSRLRQEAFEWEADRLQKKTSGEIYIEYMMNQAKCIKDLTDLADEFIGRKHYSALVSAVRARSDIYDKVIKVGQDFGILEKAPERSEKQMLIAVGKLGNEELAGLITSELGNMDRMMSLFGNKGMLDVTPGKLHRALPAGKKTETGKKDRAKQNRRHAGRSVVKSGKRKG